MIDPDVVRRAFLDRHRRAPRLFTAPGRVNLIGEHTDHNDGFVLPVAIDRRTVVAAAPREGGRLTVRSLDLDQEIDVDLARPGPGRTGGWGDHVTGVAVALARRGVTLAGADLVLGSDVPRGGGLSSSAALQISVGLALVTLAGCDLDRRALAAAAQAAEHEHVGTRCGIMDQTIAALGRAGHALLLDCRTLEATQVPLELGDHVIVLCDSKVRHDLASSAYNERRAACERAVELLRPALPGVRALRDVSPADLDRHRGLLPDPIDRRAAHVVGENARTLAAAEALRAGDLGRLGRLMAESHRSLRDDFQVSCPELDLLVELAAGVPGVAGARMTGGGFGGCTVNLVNAAAVERFGAEVAAGFEARTGRRPDIFAVRAAGGACELGAGGRVMRALVTGGAGYVGSVVVEELLAAGAGRVVVLDDLSKGHADAVVDPATLVRGDVADGALVERVCRDERIDVVVHLAARSLVGESVQRPADYYRANVTGGLALLDALCAAGVRRLVFSSSAAVYGEPAESPITEAFATEPTNPYGDTKLALERALGWYDRAYGLRSASLRYFNAAGATAHNGEQHDPETHLVPSVLAVAQGRAPAVTVFGADYPTPDGTCVRDYIHVSDLARAHVLAIDALDRLGSRIYNLGCGGGFSVAQVVEAARAVTGHAIPTMIGARRAGDPPVLVASSERIRTELGWQPVKQDLAVILSDAWAWTQAHPRGYTK